MLRRGGALSGSTTLQLGESREQVNVDPKEQRTGIPNHVTYVPGLSDSGACKVVQHILSSEVHFGIVSSLSHGTHDRFGTEV